MKTKSSKRTFNYLPWLLVLIFTNLLILDLFFVSSWYKKLNVLGVSDSPCPSACLSLINRSTGTSAKEFYISLGTGSNASSDWADVTGAKAYIDTTSYGKIKKVTFEASLQVPSGSQISYVRLFNATDKHAVWFSEISLAGSGPELLTSSPIALDPGNKLYQVQMKSQLAKSTSLLFARIHILTY
ncbi:hypothetical protein KKB64_03735 [Patescibacteria group bacterium]|nr:hypothetical protein [Patescibacteria group bacterium]MBU1472868.1 hypothetical protein [Patescibacteria group bacterium]MBU2460070.1 hypothetical protein [Patescibacteria group bacterium]MBU2544766.1 hypothetical protein [Patescibacteria group bacterium]